MALESLVVGFSKILPNLPNPVRNTTNSSC